MFPGDDQHKGGRVEVPDHLRYTADHEWVLIRPDGSVRVGITQHAREALGDIVFVTLPRPGEYVTAGVACGEVESTKSVSEIYAPITGAVTAVNQQLDNSPELMADSYGEGWMFDLAPEAPAEFGGLLDAASYQSIVS
ncbi:MAG: glycine cleavage system protein GcvH [Actinomycetota bacterium]